MSDIRLSKDTAQIDKIRKIFACNSNKNYVLYINSPMNKRGVGILISDSLNAVVEQEYTDNDENILGLIVLINGIRIKLCSIYGPNHNDKVFYDNLGKFLSVDTKYPVVIGTPLILLQITRLIRIS